MPLVPTSEIVQDAQAAGRAVGAFNAVSIETAEAIVEGAALAGRPVILQVSENAVIFHHHRLEPLGTALLELARSADTPISIHLDHATDDDLCRRAVGLGFSSVMFDASRLSYEENVRRTRDIAQWCHDRGAWLEAELGEVGGKDGVHAPGVRTDPRQAAEFVDATQADMLAIAVGSSHAMTTKSAEVDLDLVTAIQRSVAVPLVLHGSSGVSDAQFKRLATAGLVKVNVSTQLNVHFTAAVREILASNPTIVDPRKYLSAARDRMASEVARVLELL